MSASLKASAIAKIRTKIHRATRMVQAGAREVAAAEDAEVSMFAPVDVSKLKVTHQHDEHRNGKSTSAAGRYNAGACKKQTGHEGPYLLCPGGEGRIRTDGTV